MLIVECLRQKICIQEFQTAFKFAIFVVSHIFVKSYQGSIASYYLGADLEPWQ